MKFLSLEDLRDRLEIDRDALDEEISAQPSLYDQVAEQAVLAISRRDQAKWDMEKAYIEACDEARYEAVRTKERTTEAAIKEAATLSKAHVTAEKTYRATKQEAELWDALRSSFDQRGKMLRELAQLWIAGFYQASSVGEKERHQVREHDRESGRKALAATRRRI